MVADNSQVLPSLDVWTSALLSKSTAGRGSNGKLEAYGIKKLRELILELAVRGKLVAQDPNDEAASDLLEQTVAEKRRLIKEGVIRESRPPVFPVESPGHQLPASWVWTNLFEIGEIAPRNEADDKVEASFVPMQAISEKYGTPVQNEVKRWGEIKSGFTHFQEEDIVLAKITPCFQNGKSAVMRGLTNGFGAGTTELHVYRAINACTIPEYVLVYLKSPRFIGNGIPKMTGTAGQKRITRDYFGGNHFPLPPLAEQHRIVAKVEELIALCDQLEQQQTDSLAAHQTLVETLLGALTRVESQQEFSAAWARIASHFDTLFTTEASVDQLKQTILQLAVMGKLVPQEPNDEDVQVLLMRSDLSRREAAEKDKRADVDPQNILSADDRWEIPASWNWRGLADLVLFVDYRGKTPIKQSSGIRLLTAKNVRQGQIDLMPEEFLTEHEYKDWMTRGLPKVGDVLFTTEAPMGNAAVVELTVQFALAQRVICFQNYGALDPAFLVIQILSNQFQYILDKNGTGMTARGIKASKLKQLPIAIPPLAEQHRIVAKVNELMALCDALKARLADAQTIQLHLADAIVEQAVC